MSASDRKLPLAAGRLRPTTVARQWLLSSHNGQPESFKKLKPIHELHWRACSAWAKASGVGFSGAGELFGSVGGKPKCLMHERIDM